MDSFQDLIKGEPAYFSKPGSWMTWVLITPMPTANPNVISTGREKSNQARTMRMTDHIAQSSLVGSLVARLARDDSGGRARRGMILARFVRDDTAVACKMTRLGVTSPCILALVGALPRVRPFFLFTVAPGLLVRTRGLNNSLKKLEASSTKIFQYFPTDM